MFRPFALILFSLTTSCYGTVKCPPNKRGEELTKEDNQIVHEVISDQHRPQRFIAYGSTFQIDYTLLIIGLIISVILSVLCSFFCCLLCNGCWLHRRRNPQLYESVNESGFYPLCCGFGIPMGTIVFSTHPPQFRDESELYG
uniref:Uncharacterized protein n=1 Tax=Elaeophora elaphi TaxID=1147741 RepID=A0A0R3RLP9_9BILA